MKPDPKPLIGGKFQIEGQLGEGGMGVVWKARDLELGRPVAIKQLQQSQAGSTGSQRLVREARAAAQLTSVHTARIYEVASDEAGAPYVVMEFLKGQDLAQELKSGALEPRRAVGLVIEACDALAEAHALGIFHRDLKPANLFVEHATRGECLKVLDFGIAKWTQAPDGQLTQSGQAPGTPAYMAPEQLMGGPIDARVDVWGLGVTLYQLLSGQLPTHMGTAPPLDRLDLGIDEELSRIVARCVELDPARRYDGAAELARALAPFADPTHGALAERLGRAVTRQGHADPGSAGASEASTARTEAASSEAAGAQANNAPAAGTLGSSSVDTAAPATWTATHPGGPEAPGTTELRQVLPKPWSATRWLSIGALLLGGVAFAVYRLGGDAPPSPSEVGATTGGTTKSSALGSIGALGPTRDTATPRSDSHNEATAPALSPKDDAGTSAPSAEAIPEPAKAPVTPRKRPVRLQKPRKARAKSKALCTDGKNLCPCDDPNCRPP